MPVQLIWAADGTIARCFDVLDLWKRRADRVAGHPIDASHYMAEETPELVAAMMLDFFSRCR